MELTKKQKIDLETVEYFIPSGASWGKRNKEDIQRFFENSERGLHKELARLNTFTPEGRTYFHALLWGKTWRGRHMHELYEPGVLDGSMPYCVILGCEPYSPKVPVAVKNFMKKEMFGGIDAEIIENCYQTK